MRKLLIVFAFVILCSSIALADFFGIKHSPPPIVINNMTVLMVSNITSNLYCDYFGNCGTIAQFLVGFSVGNYTLNVSGDTGQGEIFSGDIFSVIGGGATWTVMAGKTLTIFSNDTKYTHLSNFTNDVDFYNETRVNQSIEDFGNDTFLRLDTANDPLTGELDMGINNITNIQQLIALDGSAIRFGAEMPFSGIDQAIVIISNQTLGPGVITHALLDNQGQKVIAAWQSGKNNSGHFERNSGGNFPDLNITNVSILTNMEEMWRRFGITPLADYFSVENKTSRAALWAFESQKLFLHDDIGNGQLLGEGDFRWIARNDSDIDLYQGAVHIRDEKIKELGLPADFNFTVFIENFESGTLGQFDLITTGKGLDEWVIDTGTDCPTTGDGFFCAGAGPTGGVGNTIMEANFSTNNLELLELSFALNTADMSTGGDLEVTINNNSGSGDVSLYDTQIDVSDSTIAVAIPSSMDNVSKVSLNFLFSSSHPIRGEAWVDLIKINGTTLSSTLANVTVQDGKVELGDGRCTIELDETETYNLTIDCPNIKFVGNVTQETINIVSTNATGDIEAENLIARDSVNSTKFCFTGDGCISNWNDINNTTWNRSGTNLFPSFINGNVGIGTTTPSSKLQVEGVTNTTTLNVEKGFEYGGRDINFTNNNSGDKDINFYFPNGANGLDKVMYYDPEGNAYDFLKSIVLGVSNSLNIGNLKLDNNELSMTSGAISIFTSDAGGDNFVYIDSVATFDGDNNKITMTNNGDIDNVRNFDLTGNITMQENKSYHCWTPDCSVSDHWNGSCFIQHTPTTEIKQGSAC